MFESSLIIEPVNEDDLPFEAGARVASGDFFAMFNVPFIYGSGWDRSADAAAEPVVVLSKQLNERLFGGEDSVGKRLIMQNTQFQVVGVIDTWEPTPRFFDPINGGFQEINEMFIPYSLTRSLELISAGSDWGWKSEEITSFEQWLNSESAWIQYFVELESPRDRDAYLAHLDAYVGEQKRLGRFERPLNNQYFQCHGVDGVPRSRCQRLQGPGGSVIPVPVGLSAQHHCIVADQVCRQAGETSLRRALGASRKIIFKQQIVEVAVIGFSGGLVGLLLAGLGLQGIQYLYESPDGLVTLDWVMMLTAIGIAITSSMIAGLYPAWRVCKIPPAAQLKTQ